jgi:hypothetical protein
VDFAAVAADSLAFIEKRRVGDVYGPRGSGYHVEERASSAANLAATTASALIKYKDAGNFFLGILRSFRLTPVERKEIESAARFFGTRSKNVKLPAVDWMPVYNRYFDKLEEFYRLAQRIIARGEACTSEQFCTARCFRLVNTGGFPEATMQAVQKVVDRAAQLLDERGFDRLCYGDVNVTQTVMRNARVLAFYTIGDDRMYVRANLKGVEGAALHTILHELGHRLDHRIVTAQGRSNAACEPVFSLFGRYRRDARDREPVVGGVWPVVGDPYEYKGEKFRVKKVELGRGGGGGSVTICLEDDPRGCLRTSIDSWRLSHGGVAADKKGPFPSEYAMTDVAEFFAEMFAGSMLDTLTPAQREDFEPILASFREPVSGRAGGRARTRR